MQDNTTNYPNFKEIEQLMWRKLQETFSEAMVKLLEDIDEQIAVDRDKKRFRLQDKRELTLVSLFGELTFKRNYYRDNETGKYISLLDRYLEFEGFGGFSPLLEEAAIELAVSGSSYRKAANTLETLLGYRVMSHEAIRQHLLKVESIPKEREPLHRPVLFVEVDGLYIKSQEKRKRGREVKIAAVHQGWEKNGKRAKLIGKRHYIHEGKEPFWEGFETFLMEAFDYDPTRHLLIINGDGANWITACREYFQRRIFFSIDRFHVAKAIRALFHKHPRYLPIRKALAAYDGERVLLELNSAVGTLDTEKKEENLRELIQQLEQYPEALGDYRNWLEKKGISTEGMRPMGSAEGTMSVFAKRLKHGRSWVEQGSSAMMTAMVAILDKLAIKILFNRMDRWVEKEEETKTSKTYTNRIGTAVTQAARGSIPYLNGKANIPIYVALKQLKGF